MLQYSSCCVTLHICQRVNTGDSYIRFYFGIYVRWALLLTLFCGFMHDNSKIRSLILRAGDLMVPLVAREDIGP